MAGYEIFKAPSVIEAEEKAKREHLTEAERRRAEERAEAYRKEVRRMDEEQEKLERDQRRERQLAKDEREKHDAEVKALAESMILEHEAEELADKLYKERNMLDGDLISPMDIPIA